MLNWIKKMQSLVLITKVHNHNYEKKLLFAMSMLLKTTCPKAQIRIIYCLHKFPWKCQEVY